MLTSFGGRRGAERPRERTVRQRLQRRRWLAFLASSEFVVMLVSPPVVTQPLRKCKLFVTSAPSSGPPCSQRCRGQSRHHRPGQPQRQVSLRTAAIAKRRRTPAGLKGPLSHLPDNVNSAEVPTILLAASWERESPAPVGFGGCGAFGHLHTLTCRFHRGNGKGLAGG